MSSAWSGAMPPKSPRSGRRSTSWWKLGAQKSYHDGNRRPVFRGWIHGGSTFLALPLLLHWILLGVPLQLVCCLAAKIAVYAASATFHLVSWKLPHLERRALIVDVSLVPLAILGGVLPFSELGGIGMAKDCVLGVGVLALNIALVAWQFRHGPKYVPLDSTPRSIVCIIYFLYNEFAAGRALGFSNGLWMLTPVFYVSAFLCAAGVDKFRERSSEPLVFPHHRNGLWSLHEDFHFLLLVGDLFSAWLGWTLAFSPAALLGSGLVVTA